MNEFKLPIVFNWQNGSKKIEKTVFYEHDFAASAQIKVRALKGVIELTNLNTALTLAPEPGCASSVQLSIFNPRLNYTNSDRVYVQTTIYYKPGIGDEFVPYIVSSGATLQGALFNLYNVSNEVAGIGQFTGKLYINYEIYSF